MGHKAERVREEMEEMPKRFNDALRLLPDKGIIFAPTPQYRYDITSGYKTLAELIR